MRVSDLYIFPVKSFREVQVASAVVTERGLQHDREYMVVFADSGAMITQRQNPYMILLQPTP